MKKKTKFIAEIGSNHNRNLKRVYKLINKAKELEFYAVKFQFFKIEKLYSKKAKKLYQKALKKKKRELPAKFIPKISNYCKRKKIKFICTPFDIESIDFLKKYVDYFKIASYELNWKKLLLLCAKTKKPIIISTGMATSKEVKNSFNLIKKINKNISLLHCVSSYPAKVSSCNLNSIQFLRKKFKCPVGWSDHTVNPLIIFNVVKYQKADYVEMHFDLDGKGWEEKEGNHHCWLPKNISEIFDFIKREKTINGKFTKKYSLEEKKERNYRADPVDGLRPIKSYRKYL